MGINNLVLGALPLDSLVVNYIKEGTRHIAFSKESSMKGVSISYVRFRFGFTVVQSRKRIGVRTTMFRFSSKGQGLAEYALILALVAIVAVVALLFLSGEIKSILSIIGKSL